MYNPKPSKIFNDSTDEANLEKAKRVAYKVANKNGGSLELYRYTMDIYGYIRNEIGDWVKK